jgi:hypothetical protein
MSNNVVVRNLTAGATYVDLPANTTRDARIEVTFQGGTTGSVKAKQDSNNPSRLLFNNPIPANCTVVVEIDQDESFNASYTGRVADYDSTRNYAKGSEVFFKARVYRACADIPANTVFKSTADSETSAKVWYNTAGDTGTVIDSIITHSVVDGYWALDGSTINAPWSILHNLVTPDTRQRVLVGAVASLPANDYRSNLQYSGNSAQTINVNNLPTNSFQLSITADGGHYPAGSVNVSQHNGYRLQSYNRLPNGTTSTAFMKPYDTRGNPDGAADSDGSSWYRMYWRAQEWYDVYADVPAQNHSASFSGSWVGHHNHAGSMVTLNTSGSQAAISVMQPQMSINRYVRL